MLGLTDMRGKSINLGAGRTGDGGEVLLAGIDRGCTVCAGVRPPHMVPKEPSDQP